MRVRTLRGAGVHAGVTRSVKAALQCLRAQSRLLTSEREKTQVDMISAHYNPQRRVRNAAETCVHRQEVDDAAI